MLPGAYVLTESDRPAVDVLRLEALAKTGPFVARDEAVTWSSSDAAARVLGIYSETGALLASLRVEHLSTPEGLREKLDYDHLHEVIELPCGLIGKAVSRVETRGLGLNTYLQYLAYRYLHARGVRYVAATIVQTAVYVPMLRRLGFTFIENPNGWYRYGYDSRGPTYVVYLDLAREYDRLMAALEPKVAGLKLRFPYRAGPFRPATPRPSLDARLAPEVVTLDYS